MLAFQIFTKVLFKQVLMSYVVTFYVIKLLQNKISVAIKTTLISILKVVLSPCLHIFKKYQFYITEIEDLVFWHCRILTSHEGKGCRIFLIQRLREIVLLGYCVFSWYWLIFKMKNFCLMIVFTELLVQSTRCGKHCCRVLMWFTVSYIFGFWIKVLVKLLTLFGKIYCTDHQPLKCWCCNWTHTGYVYLVFK